MPTIAYAQRCWNADVNGYYVVNPRTRIAVDGPYDSQEDAQRSASRRNAELPIASDLLEVRLIEPRPDAHVWSPGALA